MNILHIISASNVVDGISTVLLCLSAEQRKLGHNVKVINIRNNANHIDGFENISDSNRLIDSISAGYTDIVVFHSVYYMAYVKIAASLKHKNIPYLIQLHGALSKKNYSKGFIKKWIANLLFFKKFIKQASAIIYLNQGELNHSIVPAINPVARILPNGCYLPVSPPAIEETARFSIIYLGRIDKHHKGLDILFEALNRLNKNDRQSLTIDFYGTGKEKDMAWFTEKLSQFSDLAKYHGAVYGDDKIAALKTHNAIILTSRYEGMPMGILEALSLGLPCIVTEQTNMADVVIHHDCGWVAELNACSITNTILQAQERYRKDKQLLSANARIAASCYSWPKIAQQSIEYYQTVIDTLH